MYIDMFLKIEIGSLIYFLNNNIPRIYCYTFKWTSEPNFNGLPSIPFLCFVSICLILLLPFVWDSFYVSRFFWLLFFFSFFVCFLFCLFVLIPFVAITNSLWDLSSPTRSQICDSGREGLSPGHWTTKELLISESIPVKSSTEYKTRHHPTGCNI